MENEWKEGVDTKTKAFSHCKHENVILPLPHRAMAEWNCLTSCSKFAFATGGMTCVHTGDFGTTVSA